MEQVEMAVAYDGLPISSGGAHGLGRMPAGRAAATWMEFLSTRAQASEVLCSFDLNANPLVGFGRSAARLIGREFPPTLGDRKHFSVPEPEIETAVAIFDSLGPVPVARDGAPAVTLTLGASFRLLDPTTKEIWPHQDPGLFNHFRTPAGVTLGASTSRLTLGSRHTMGLLLSIPQASDQDLTLVIPWLDEALPMKLSAKHWTRWSRTENGRSYRGVRIKPTT